MLTANRISRGLFYSALESVFVGLRGGLKLEKDPWVHEVWVIRETVEFSPKCPVIGLLLKKEESLLLPRSFQEDILAVNGQSIESREPTGADAGFRKGGGYAYGIFPLNNVFFWLSLTLKKVKFGSKREGRAPSKTASGPILHDHYAV